MLHRWHDIACLKELGNSTVNMYLKRIETSDLSYRDIQVLLAIKISELGADVLTQRRKINVKRFEELHLISNLINLLRKKHTWQSIIPSRVANLLAKRNNTPVKEEFEKLY